MPPVYKARDPAGNITEISQYFRELTLDVTTNAEEGSNAQSTVQADDPDGTFDLVGHRIFSVQEDTAPAASSNSYIYVGYSAARRISRGPYHRTQAGRVWDIDLVDLNSVLPRRIMDGTDSNRPAETDVARITWLLGTTEAEKIDDSLYFNTSGGVAMDAADYRGQRFDGILDDCGQASGKNWFVWWRQETGQFSLWYDFASSTNYTSIIRLSNVLSDIDNVWTFGIAEDTELQRSPDRVNSGVYLDYDGGHVYEQKIATATAFAQRDASVPAENVKTAAKATARAIRYLGDMDSEDDIITTSFIVPLAKVNFLMQGMRVQFRASHLPGYEAFSWFRALNRTVKQVSEEFYEIKMDLVPIAAAAAPPSCAVQVAGMTTLFDGGTMGAYGPPGTGDHLSTPVTVPAPSSSPAVVIAFNVFNSTWDDGGKDFDVTDASWLTLQRYFALTDTAATATSTLIAYQSVSGAPASLSYSWARITAGFAYLHFRGLGIALNTHATAPVHTGQTNVSGATVTLNGTPTVGDILVLCAVTETSGGGQWSGPPAGWTVIDRVNLNDYPRPLEPDGVTTHLSKVEVCIAVRCVQQGDTATYTLTDHSFSHWFFLSEWAIT